MLMGSDKVTEQELTALVTSDSSSLPTLAVPEYKLTEPGGFYIKGKS